MNRCRWRIRLALSLLMLVSVSLSTAAETPSYDRVQLSAQAVADVENDTLVAVLSVQRQGTDVARLATEVNQVMAGAIKRCKQVTAVSVQTLDYQTNPVYEKQHRTGWSVTQSLELRSGDSDVLSHLLGELQANLMLQSMQYEVSAKRLEQAQASLIGQAIASFSRRAQEITHHLGRKRYRLVNLRVDTGGNLQQPPTPRYRVMAEASSAPSLEPGKQQVTVTVSGEIELLMD
ncbi:MAG: DUF541 domain-containing protein [Gammaproteobacteria bacterium]|nr:DUF541 domain-containing protein [Gammaproteobacteria bacterium]